MATPASAPVALNLAAPSLQSHDISRPIPHFPHTTLRVRATATATSSLVFVTTTDPGAASSAAALGSFVYAMPNLRSPSAPPLCTALVLSEGSLELAERVARLLARRTGKPAYVGCSARFDGGSMEEVLEATRELLQAALEGLEKADRSQANGSGPGEAS